MPMPPLHYPQSNLRVYTQYPPQYAYAPYPPPYVRSSSGGIAHPPIFHAVPPLPSPATATAPSSMGKQPFMDLFSTLYDQIEETNKLNASLKENIRKSSVLLQTLQGSGEMIEALVKRCVNEMGTQDKSHISSSLDEIKQRLNLIERHVGLQQRSVSPANDQ